MGFRKLRRNESGAAAVVVALALTVLCGFTALTIDFGMMASTKQDMQNAADAAALAAAADIESGFGVVENIAKEYARINGYDDDAPGVTVEVDLLTATTVKVTIREEVQMGFSTVLTGDSTRPVSASATAELTDIFGTSEYALFAGQRIEESGTGIEITGQNIFINGNMHSNSDIDMPNAILGNNCQATAVRDVNPDRNGWSEGHLAKDMPSISLFENAIQDQRNYVKIEGDITLKKNHYSFQNLVNDAKTAYMNNGGSEADLAENGLCIHVTGSITQNGNATSTYTSSYPIILIVDGDMTLNGTELSSSSEAPFYLMSKRGNITVNGGGGVFTGIVFAPEGNVEMHGNSAEFVGSIIAQNIRKTGGKITVTYKNLGGMALPKNKVHLIA